MSTSRKACQQHQQSTHQTQTLGTDDESVPTCRSPEERGLPEAAVRPQRPTRRRTSSRRAQTEIHCASGSATPPPAEPRTGSLPFPRTSKKVSRSREDIRREQQAHFERTKQELDAIVAEFHAQLPREKAQSLGAVYARHSTTFQDSLADQIRSLFEAAVRQGIFIPAENVFFDAAVRGGKERRPGLNALKAATEDKRYQVLLVFSTSRLYRKAYKAMRFISEEIVERGLRAIFVSSNLDTADAERWQMMLQMYANFDEAATRMYPDHIRAAHIGLFLRGMVCGSLPLGFTGEEVPGELTNRQRPRRRMVIDPETAPWIERIFRWYVEDGKSLDGIARDLNADPEAPAPTKSVTGMWTHRLVRDHLMKAAYRGFWTYGVKETKWSSKKDYAQQLPREEPLKAIQWENLRIISDELWYRAQQLLADERGNAGRKPNENSVQLQPRVLSKLFVCPDHECHLVVGGRDALMLFCPKCRAVRAESRPLFSHLNRSLAVRLTCERLAELIRADDELVVQIEAACQQAAAAAQRPDERLLRKLRSDLSKRSATITFNRQNPGESPEEQQRTLQLLKELERDRNQLQADLAVQTAIAERVVVVPERAEVVALLDELAGVLISAATAETDGDVRTVRRIIDELTGGRIELRQMGERKKGRGWLQGRFRVDLVSLVVGKLTGTRHACPTDEDFDVVIDYRAPQLIDEQADEAKRLFDQELLLKDIAVRMQRSRGYITKLLQHWFDSRGLPRPNGYQRRSRLKNKQTTVPAYQRLADEAARLADLGHSNRAISRQLEVSDATVVKAVVWWYRSRGLPVPSVEERRRQMLERAKAMIAEGTLIRDVAKQVGYSARGLSLALREHDRESGDVIVDGRTRRGNAMSGQSANGQRTVGDPTEAA